MANLKLDLLNKVNNEKYFAELELVRLAQEPNMNYQDKIESMDKILGDIAIMNAKLGGVDQYFKDEKPVAPTPTAPTAPAPTGQVPVAPIAPAAPVPNNGQTHPE